MNQCLKRGLSFNGSAENVPQLSPVLTIARIELDYALKKPDESLSIFNTL